MPDAQLLRKTEAALRGGCRIVQYRNKLSKPNQQSKQARSLSALCQEHQALLIVNDDLSLALEAKAQGVHLGQTDLAVKDARKQCDSDFVIGATCHDSLDLGKEAESNGANYLAFGRFFNSQTKSSASAASIDTLKIVKQQSRLPIVAIGGVTLDNAPSLINNGADCVAVCYDLFHHDDAKKIEQRAADFCRLFTET